MKHNRFSLALAFSLGKSLFSCELNFLSKGTEKDYYILYSIATKSISLTEKRTIYLSRSLFQNSRPVFFCPIGHFWFNEYRNGKDSWVD